MRVRAVSLPRVPICARRPLSSWAWGGGALDPPSDVPTGVQHELGAGAGGGAWGLAAAYRARGHLIADTLPFHEPPHRASAATTLPDLLLPYWRLQPDDVVPDPLYPTTADSCATTTTTTTAASLLARLQLLYATHISYEFEHLENAEERAWWRREVEAGEGQDTEVGAGEAEHWARLMVQSAEWDRFLGARFPALKRYGGEGAECALVALDALLEACAGGGARRVVLAAAHRARYNLLVGVLRLPPRHLLAKFLHKPELPAHHPDLPAAICDVASHYSFSGEVCVGARQEHRLHVSLLHNPSHLEAVNPVSQGKTRSIQRRLGVGAYWRGAREHGTHEHGEQEQRRDDGAGTVVNVQIHGDAALAGQGVNQEALQLSRAPHYALGGSLHVLINNGLGFTAPPRVSRSTAHATDVVRAAGAPVVHVHGTQPALVARAARLVARYRQRWRRDAALDVGCWRARGHNELDEPSLTAPLLYRAVRAAPAQPDAWAARAQLPASWRQRTADHYAGLLRQELAAAASDDYEPPRTWLEGAWAGLQQAARGAQHAWDTGVDLTLATHVAASSVTVPPHFELHEALRGRHAEARVARVQGGAGAGAGAGAGEVDWATAEAIAFGSLLWEGVGVRLAGQDVSRGTFSHRHLRVHCARTGRTHEPLNHLHAQQTAWLELADSPLSEEAALGFELGMALDEPRHLHVWEAQFGDFFNTAQAIVDTFLVSSESKWARSHGLVVLLPHGSDGAGAEHSSARPERWLQLVDSDERAPDCDAVNLRVAHPTTPAQYFHLLRAAVAAPWRKPLVVFSAKTLLRLPAAVSPLADLAPGTCFQPVLVDAGGGEGEGEREGQEGQDVRCVVLCSGKLYYELAAERARLGRRDVLLVRLEQLAPFPGAQLERALQPYRARLRRALYAQEESMGAGAWQWVRARAHWAGLGTRSLPLQVCAPPALPAPALGCPAAHRAARAQLLRDVFQACKC